jgi:hypothetical protein
MDFWTRLFALIAAALTLATTLVALRKKPGGSATTTIIIFNPELPEKKPQLAVDRAPRKPRK